MCLATLNALKTFDRGAYAARKPVATARRTGRARTGLGRGGNGWNRSTNGTVTKRLTMMLLPRKALLEEAYREVGHQIRICMSPANPNARLFKTYWRLFTRHSPWEGSDFLDQTPQLCSHDAEYFVRRCCETGEPVWAYPFHVPRWDPAIMPWNLDSQRWKDVPHWAPAFDEDPDPITATGYR